MAGRLYWGRFMLWFKHLKDARNDPFIWDLRQRFGPDGYFVYFATLEIYADNFKALPGWFLDISIAYLKHELQIYHSSKLKQIIDFIRFWPKLDPDHDDRFMMLDSMKSEMAPKWIVQLTDTRIALLIPTFTRMMDNYTAQQMRQTERDQGNGDKNKPAGHLANDVLSAFRDIARDCEILAGLPPINGRQFSGTDFVGWCVRNNYHPGAIRDGTAALVQQSGKWTNINDPWAYGRGVVKTRAGHYDRHPINPAMVKAIFGGFFNGTGKAKGGNDATGN